MSIEIEQLTESGIYRPVKTVRTNDEAIKLLRYLVVEGGHDPASFRVREFADQCPAPAFGDFDAP